MPFSLVSIYAEDALWLVLVLILGASLLVVMVPEDEAVPVSEDDIEEEISEEATCVVGTEKVLNASAETGFDCVPLDPHSMYHIRTLLLCYRSTMSLTTVQPSLFLEM